MRPHATVLFAGLVGMAVSSACREVASPRPPTPNVVASRGSGQSAERLDTLPQLLIVQVVDDGGDPVEGAPITWSISDEAGRLVAADTTTDGQGEARATVILGFAPGVQYVEARARGFDDVARFIATATSAPGFKAVSLMKDTGENHMCAIDAEGRAWCWGNNDHGELGDGSLEPSAVPRLVTTTERFTRLWGTWGTTCGLTPAGRLFCWGLNLRGESGGVFGNGAVEGSRVPVAAGGGMSFKAFDLASSTACGVTLAGEAFCWGSGTLGNGASNSESLVPAPLSGGGVWREIATDDGRGCAVSETGEPHCWTGFDPPHAIGVDVAEAFAPIQVSLVPALSGISLNWHAQCGMRAGYGAVCWGAWLYGLDRSAAPGPEYPRPAGEKLERILATNETIMGRGPSGRLWIWGEPPGGNDGWISDRPVALKPAGPWLDFKIGDGAFAIHASDSTVWRWPANAFGGFYEILGGSLVPEPVLPAPSESSVAD